MKRREPLPDLAHVLEDSRPHRAELGVPLEVASREKRVHSRFDKAFLVMVGSELYGDTAGIARNVSAGGILVELSYAPPLGTIVTVHFQHLRGEDQVDEIVARAEVKHHHYLNFAGSGEAASSRAVGLRFLEFVDAGERIDADRLH
ncbi:MAG TPA: PilZ domain-containing protein [Kofleriaceae bacterium]|nr:PilZ domain-containing protein [Kofleriaceae bacterium]